MSNPRVNKGDVVMVSVPYLDASHAVRRPALVICDTSRMLDVIIAAITSRIRKPLPPTHYVVDRSHPDWRVTGLRLDSVVRCDRLFTVHDSQIHKTIGRISSQSLSEIDAVLKRAFRIS